MTASIIEFAEAATWQWGWWSLLAIEMLLVAISIPSVLLKRSGKPQAAISWVMILILLPFVGFFFWWAIGRRHLVRRQRKRRRTAATMAERIDHLQSNLPTPAEPTWALLDPSRLPPEEATWAFEPTAENCVRMLVDAEEVYPAIEQLIHSAEHHIHLLFYIWEPDATGRRFRDLLAQRAREGVAVRVLLDAVGSARSRRRFMDPLREAGAEVAAFSPPVLLRRRLELNFRNHRKLVVADSRAAIVGGLNIGDEYVDNWRDTAVSLEGAAVDQLQEVFAEDWFYATNSDFTTTDYFGGWHEGVGDEVDNGLANSVGNGDVCRQATCQLVPSGPHTEMNLTRECFFIAITQATGRVYLTTPYFIPEPSIQAALQSAVLRGVDVRILVPAHSDSPLVALAGRSYYRELLRSGVRIYEYQPAILHAKTAVVDDHVSFVGSANMDIRSFRLNFELSCFLYNAQLNADLARQFEIDLSLSRELQLSEVEDTSLPRRLAESTAHLLSPLL